jgi:hypothetical protein
MDNPGAGRQQQEHFHQGRKIFHLAMSVSVLTVSGLAGGPHGETGNEGGSEVQTGMRRLGQNAKTAGQQAGHSFQAGQEHRRPN